MPEGKRGNWQHRFAQMTWQKWAVRSCQKVNNLVRLKILMIEDIVSKVLGKIKTVFLTRLWRRLIFRLF